MRQLLLILTALSLTLCSPKSESKDIVDQHFSVEIEHIHDFITQIINDFEIGGAIGIGIVKDGEVVLEKAYGFRDHLNALPATAETPFYIASMTKSFIGTLAALLDENDEINLGDSLINSLGFSLPKDFTIEDKTIEDLFTHTSGIENSIVSIKTAYTGNFSEKEIYDDLETFSYPIAMGYQYSNLGYIIGALIFKKQLLKDWKELLETRLWEPLKMSRTSAKVSSFDPDEIAKPHTLSSGIVKTASFLKKDDTMHAAGGMLTTIEDMNKWMNFHLGKGPELLSEDAFNYIHSDLVGLYEKMGTLNSYGYGLGWRLADWKEYEISWHGGGYPGYRSLCLLSRTENLGITILMNQESPSLTLVADFLLGNFLKIPDFETFISTRKANLMSGWERYQFVRDSTLTEGNKKYKLTRSIKSYEGVFLNEELGEIVANTQSASLQLSIGNLTFNTNYIGDDSFFFFSDSDQLYGTMDFYFETIDQEETVSSLDFSGLEYKLVKFKGQ
ncbi:MAG: serine hydrolase domain-containing protein [Cyclobacteriaceae bacterium]